MAKKRVKKCGQMKYIPNIVMETVKDIKEKKNIQQDADAFREMVGYANVGREVERLMHPFGSKKKNKRGGIF